MDICKSMKPDEIHPQLLVELIDVFARPLSIIFERSWQKREVSDDWKNYVIPVFRKSQKEDSRSLGSGRHTSVPGKVISKSSWKTFPNRLRIRSQ